LEAKQREDEAKKAEVELAEAQERERIRIDQEQQAEAEWEAREREGEGSSRAPRIPFHLWSSVAIFPSENAVLAKLSQGGSRWQDSVARFSKRLGVGRRTYSVFARQH
jgi:hypothetical protein